MAASGDERKDSGLSVSSGSTRSGHAAVAPKTRDFAVVKTKRNTSDDSAKHTIPIKAAKEPVSVWARMKAFPKIGGKA